MRLLIAHHLHPVLDIAQEPVGGNQLLGGFPIDPVGPCQAVQHRLGGAQPQFLHPPAGDQLLRLDEELDFPDAAPTKLDIVAFDGDLAMSLMGMDLPLDRMDIGNGRIVEIFAEHERRQFPQEGIPCLEVARHRPRLDERRPLPVLAPAFIIEHRRLDWDGKRRRPGVRTQAQIGPEHVAVAGALLQDADQAAQQTGECLRRVVAGRDQRRLRFIEHHEVDIRRVVQLEGAELSHAEHDHTRPVTRMRGIDDIQLACVMGAQKQMIDGSRYRSTGKIAQPARGLTRIEKARKVGKGNRKGNIPLGLPQTRHDLGIRHGFSGVGPFPGIPRRLDARFQIGDQRAGKRLHKHLRMRNSRVPQIRRERQRRDNEILEWCFRSQEIGNLRMALCDILEA